MKPFKFESVLQNGKKTNCFVEWYEDIMLQESPTNVGKFSGQYMDNYAYNLSYTNEKVIDKLKKIDSFLSYGFNIDVYQEANDKSNFTLYFVMNSCIIQAIFDYKVNNVGIIATGMWNYKQAKGIFRQYFFDYLLPKFKYIISDNALTNEGENFWKKVIDYGLKMDYKVGIIRENFIKEMNSLERFEENNAWNDPFIKIWIKDKK